MRTPERMVDERVFQVVRLTDEDGTWFWTNQKPDEPIEEDRLIGPFETEEQAKNDAIATITGSGITSH
jgi:hypothetical protein